MGIIVSIVLFIFVVICIVVFAFIVPEQKRLAKAIAKRAKLKALEDAKCRAIKDSSWAKNIADCEAFAQKKAKQQEWAQANPVEARLEAERWAAAESQIGRDMKKKMKKIEENKDLAEAIARALRKPRY